LHTIAFYTLGCKVNQYETDSIKEQFAALGFVVVDFADIADVYLINTCTVTNISDRKSRQMIRRATKMNESAVVVVTGCYSQTSPDEVAEIQGVSLIVGTDKRGDIVSQTLALLNKQDHQQTYEPSKKPKVQISDVSTFKTFEPIHINDCEDRTRVYMKIQDGCNNYCAYCKIPLARGPVRSRPPEEVLKEAVRLVNAGFKEIVLTGIHLASYGKDFGTGIHLVDIMKTLTDPFNPELSGLLRLRLGSIEPTSLTNEFIECVSNTTKICQHFHVSLQSGCDKTLKNMNRKYTSEFYFDAVSRLRKQMPDVAITTDIIVGFPGETESDFMETFEFAKKIRFAKIHVFKFSPRKETKAAQMSDQIAPQIKEDRSERLITLAKAMEVDFNKKMLGKVWDVLVEEGRHDGLLEGCAGNYVKLRFEGPEELKGEVIRVRAMNVQGDGVLGEIV